jgi:hypothetical protein
MSEGTTNPSWWEDEEIITLIIKVAKAGKLDIVGRKLAKISNAVENGADIRKINEFVMKGKFDGHNIDELIEQAK